MTEKPSFAQVTVRGTLWSYAINYGGRVVSLISTIILARMLSQDDFGVAGYALVFTSFIDVLSGLGIAQAIIYHDREEGIADTAFWTSLGIGALLFVITWFTAPLGGLYFRDARAVPVIQALGLTYPLAALSNVHSALLRKNFSFGKQFVPEFSNAVVKAIISIGMALLGFGPWSLIFGQVISKLVATVVYWIVLPWRPSLRFVRVQFKKLIGYGFNNSMVDIVSIVQSNVDYLLVSRFLGAAALGVYTLAFRLPEILIMQFCSAVATVIFPVFTTMKEDTETLQRGFLKATQYSAIIVVPIALGLSLVARPVVLLLFSEKWLDAIPVIQAISIYMLSLALPFHAGVVYRATGKQYLLTRLTILEIIILTPALYWVVTTYQSITAVGWAQAFFALIFGGLQVWMAVRILKTSLLSFFSALAPALLGGLLMSAAVYAVMQLVVDWNLWFQLLAAMVTGGVVYCGILFLTNREAITTMAQTIKSVLVRKPA